MIKSKGEISPVSFCGSVSVLVVRVKQCYTCMYKIMSKSERVPFIFLNFIVFNLLLQAKSHHDVCHHNYLLNDNDC